MPSTTLPTRALAVGLALATTLLVAGCSSSDDSTDTAADTSADTSASSPAATPTAATTSSPAAAAVAQPDLDVKIDGDSVTPRGDRIKVEVGKPITIHVVSDRAGELHVHSSPEQELAYGVGESDLTLTIDVPGIIDVEDHVSDTVIAQLEVS